MQDLWIEHVGWDEQIPEKFMTKWNFISQEYPRICELSIPRYYGCLSSTPVVIHGFSDASKRIYATAVYLQFEADNAKRTKLVCAKSRVTHAREKMNIPRFELQGMYLCSQVVQNIVRFLPFNISRIILWTDSQIVLWWLSNNKNTKVFVANRIKKIKELGAETRYCPTESNLADMPTRGMRVSSLKENNVWWNGPDFLNDDESRWPLTVIKPPINDESCENETSMLQIVTGPREGPPFGIQAHHFSSFRKLIRITAYMDRAVKAFKHQPPHFRYITAQELKDAKISWFRYLQKESFSKELALLQNKKNINTGIIGKCSLEIKDDGLIHAKSRLQLSELPELAISPILLPKDNLITKLLVEEIHRSNKHIGVKHTLMIL